MVGQFFTPEIVTRAMLRLARYRPGLRVIDPSCGDGAFLRPIAGHPEVHGCECDPRYAAVVSPILRSKCFIHGDALTSLVPVWGTFELVIGNPPFSAQASLERRAEVLQGYDLGAGRPSQCLEVLFLELFLKLAKPRGRIAIILPDGPLSNAPFSGVRAWLLRHAHVETIVSLPRGTFHGTTAKANILIARKLTPSHQPNREPTRLVMCEELAELDSLLVTANETAFTCSAVLADARDWRPEAHNGQYATHHAETVRLGDVFTLRTGAAKYGGARKLFDKPARGRLLLLRAKNLAPGGGLRLKEKLAYISRAGVMFKAGALVAAGELLFVRVGAGCYGRVAVVPRGLEAQADDWLHVLTPTVKLDAPAVAAWLSGTEGQSQIRRLAKGVGTLSVSKSSLAELRLPARFIASQSTLTPRQNASVPATRAGRVHPTTTVRHRTSPELAEQGA
ncbi:MAG: N-6 DNA methylase [Verrucomicrobia bacterium]|nr:N-6 DNA methylase [Verrucomicrobiota bacterium]